MWLVGGSFAYLGRVHAVGTCLMSLTGLSQMGCLNIVVGFTILEGNLSLDWVDLG